MQRDPLGLRLRIALFFAALALGGAGILGAGLWLGFSRAGGAPDGYVIAGIVGALGLLGLAAWIGVLFDENVAKPILALASDLHTRAVADVSAAIDVKPARYLGALAPAAQAIHVALEEARESQARAIAEKTELMARDKALLEALVRELSEGVVVISPEGQILLYNQSAIQILGAIGLDRSLDRFLMLDPVWDATQRLAVSGANRAQSFLAATRDGTRILTGAASAVRTDAEDIGFVLMFRDSTEDLRTHGELDGLLAQLIDKARRPTMAISAILDVLESGDDLDPDQIATFSAAMRDELERLSTELRDFSARRERISSRHWPLRPTSVGDMFETLAKRHEGMQVEPDADILVNCDGFAITSMLDRVVSELTAQGTRSDVVLGTALHGAEVQIVVSWTGEPFPQARLEALSDAPLSSNYGQYTGRNALDAHRTDIWIAEGRRIVLPLAQCEPGAVLDLPKRPHFYDFGLLDGAGENLADLTFVVFDTETTGLDTERDAVVQIAGVRVVRGRLVEGEVFDRLVAPGSAIPPSSTRFHGITDAMVAGAPDFTQVGREFADFCEGAVLVAHNAPFDMAFLKRLEADTGIRFDNPVLCTARLSAALDSHNTDHTLDALVENYGVSLEETHRHTALGDARATAEVFLRMLAVLSARNVRGLNEALSMQGRR